MVQGMIHNDKNSPRKKDRKRRRLVKGISTNMMGDELPSTLHRNADAKQIKESGSKSTLVSNVSTAPSRLKIVIHPSRKTTTSKDYAKPPGVDDETLTEMRTKRKADGLRDDYEDDCAEDDEDVPLTMRKSQLEKRKQKVLRAKYLHAIIASKMNSLGKVTMEKAQKYNATIRKSNKAEEEERMKRPKNQPQ